MKIATARVIVTCPGRNFVTLKIETDQGVDINEQLAENYPYKAASLPVARLADGTMWNW
jgi:hypothetical protein